MNDFEENKECQMCNRERNALMCYDKSPERTRNSSQFKTNYFDDDGVFWLEWNSFCQKSSSITRDIYRRLIITDVWDILSMIEFVQFGSSFFRPMASRQTAREREKSSNKYFSLSHVADGLFNAQINKKSGVDFFIWRHWSFTLLSSFDLTRERNLLNTLDNH